MSWKQLNGIKAMSLGEMEGDQGGENRGVRAWASRGEGANSKGKGLPLGRKPGEGEASQGKAGGCC